jgi:hypothetical protein
LAEELDLPLHLFLIIDSPIKNIGTEVNKDIFIAFYKHLYRPSFNHNDEDASDHNRHRTFCADDANGLQRAFDDCGQYRTSSFDALLQPPLKQPKQAAGREQG